MLITDLPEVKPGFVRLVHSTHKQPFEIIKSLEELGLKYMDVPDSTMDVMGGTGRWQAPFTDYLIKNPRSHYGPNVVIIDIPIQAYKEWRDHGAYRNYDEPDIEPIHRPGGKKIVREFTKKEIGKNYHRSQYSTGKGSIIGMWDKSEFKSDMFLQRKKKVNKLKTSRITKKCKCRG